MAFCTASRGGGIGSETRVRFDDMLATVLAREPDRPAARVALWRQLVDLLAQARDGGDVALARRAYDRVVALGSEVPVGVRQEVAATIAGRPLAPSMVALMAGDVPAVAGAMLSRVRLSEADWLELLTRLSPTGRAFLRRREDLGPRVQAALAGFGASDMTIVGSTDAVAAAGSGGAEDSAPAALPGPPATFEPGSGEGQIRAIISRIARYKRDRAAGGASDTAAKAPAASFAFETDADGILCWVEGVPRGALIGETIAVPAAGSYGVDAHAPGAFRRRAPFRDARLAVAGAGAASGEWRISAVPVFGAGDGRFLGYRGSARRPRPHERAEPTSGAGGAAGADTLRQVMHELRTPLNAIGGFAEMIRHEMRGPIAEPYRKRADGIVEQTARLLAAVDDLDMSARLDSARLDLHVGAIDLPPLVETVRAELGRAFTCDAAPDVAQAFGDASAIRRIVARLSGAAIGLAASDEPVRVVIAESGPAALTVRVTRPRRLAGIDETTLFDPGFGPDGDRIDAPLLGLGFSLHLVRRLARACGGRLSLEPDWFMLTLPAAGSAHQAGAEGAA